MEGYEEGYCRVRLQMSHITAGKSRTSEAYKTITVTPDPSVEMGENHYGFCGRTLLTDQNAYTNLVAQLPKDYCLIPGNGAIKLVETKNLLELIIFNLGFGLIYCKCTGRQVIKWI